MSDSTTVWDLHRPADDLAATWTAAGRWAEDPVPLGRLVDNSLGTFAGRPFTFRSEYRPWAGSYGQIRELALRRPRGHDTTSGKVRKAELRRQLRQEADGS